MSLLYLDYAAVKVRKRLYVTLEREARQGDRAGYQQEHQWNRGLQNGFGAYNRIGKKKTKFIKSEELNKKYAPCWKAKGVIFLCFKSWITWANSLFFVSANCTIRVRWYSAQKSRQSRLQDPSASPPLRSKV